MSAALLVQRHGAFVPINDVQLRGLRLVASLAPALDACLHSDDDREVTTVTTEVWIALSACASAYDYPRTATGTPLREAERLFAIYDTTWMLMQALDVLSRVPKPRKREHRAVTETRERWGLRVMGLHEDLHQLLQPAP